METKNLYDRDDHEKYEEIINIVNDLYLDLFRMMLDYKNVSYVNQEDNFEYLDALVRLTYPQFSQSLIECSVSRNESNHTYLDVINTLLSTYTRLKNMYNDAEFEKKYLECNPNSGDDVV